MFSNNCDGLNKKKDSLKVELQRTKSTLFTLQETHLGRKGKIQIDNMVIYEAIRKKEHGLMIGVHVAHQPVLISEYSDTFEMLVVEIKASNKEIRVINGYGPQENVDVKDRMPFFSTLEEEVVSAQMSNKSILIQMDANSKLGKEVLPKDVHEQTANGAALAGIIQRNALIVVNGLENKIEGLITRRRVTVDGTEESIIDFVTVSADLKVDLEALNIDEEKEYALAKIVKEKKSTAVKYSDHNVMVTKLKLKLTKEHPMEEEVFNLKDEECQRKFKQETSNSTKLSEIFDTDDDLEKQTKKFLKKLKRCMHKCFKKIKIKKDRESDYEKLYKEWTDMKNKEDTGSKEKAKVMEADIAEKYADGIFNQIKDETKNIKYDEGGLNSGNLWRLKNKLNKKLPEPPTAMRDSKGNLLTGKRDILEETVKYYEKVLKNRPMKEELTGYQKHREDIASARMKLASQNKTDDWTMEDLDTVLKDLKTNKSRDALGYLNELFKPKAIGSDLKLALLKLMNRIKQKQEYPKCLEMCNITSIFKRKGNISDFSQYRGIFRVLVFRSILERLIYNDEYITVDDNLTDANVGARKHRNIRDNLFVVNAILNSIKRGSEEAIDLCTYDVDKCFDAL